MNSSLRTLVFTAVLACAVSLSRADDAAADWQHIVALDAGPEAQPRTLEEARSVALMQIDLQEKALRGFLAQHPADAHVFEARMRLSRLLRIRGDFEDSDKPRAEAQRILAELDKTAATPAERTEVDFAKISAFMRGVRAPAPQTQRDQLLAMVRKFQADHPDDRRLASLLAETASLYDSQPKIKNALLSDAQPLAKDEELKGRIADDLKRLDLLGTPVPLRFTTAEGKAIDVADFRGKVIVVIFFAAWSPPSIAALESAQQTLARLTKERDRVQVLGISLDAKAETLAGTVRQHHITWPVAFDGKSWESPLVRSLGINSLPTIWLLDAQGRLRSLNAQDGLTVQMRQLLDER